MSAHQITLSPSCATVATAPHWQLPSSMPVRRPNLGSLAQPYLTRRQHTPRFQFHEASLLLIASGQLDIDDGVEHLSISTPATLLMVNALTCASLIKTPGEREPCFRSIFITLPAKLLTSFHRTYPAAYTDSPHTASFRPMTLDDDLTSTFQHVLQGFTADGISDERLECRLIELLLSLSERGYCFTLPASTSTASRLRTLISANPEHPWTTRMAGNLLAMSEATLRRRLSEEGVSFEEILVDLRMHHAMMLLQTTSWRIPHIALACGYQSAARFSERFRTRFGYLPSTVR